PSSRPSSTLPYQRLIERYKVNKCKQNFPAEVKLMCRNIKPLFNFEPAVTEDEVRAASLQFVRKVSGFNKPSRANQAAFDAAVDEIAAVASDLLRSLETDAPPKNRIEEAARARARSAQRFSRGESI